MNQELASPQTARRGQGGPWSYISPSRLNLWLKCPLAWKLRYVDGVKTPTTPNLFIGKMTHTGLEHYYRLKQLGTRLNSGDIVRHVEDRWEEAASEERIAFENDEAEQAARSQVAGLLTVYLEEVPEDEPRTLAVETTLEAPLVDPVTGDALGIPLLGIADLVLDGPNGPIVIDFKTAARSTTPLEITHEIQLSCYAWLLREHWGTIESGLEIRSLIKTKKPQLRVHRYDRRSDQHFQRLFSAIRAYLADLRSQEFIFRPGFACSWCDFRETHCQQWAGTSVPVEGKEASA